MAGLQSAETESRTRDPRFFRPVLYQLSYLGGDQPRFGGLVTGPAQLARLASRVAVLERAADVPVEPRGPVLRPWVERDRVVDETGGQTVVFGRRGSRPFHLDEMERFYRRSTFAEGKDFERRKGELYRVEDVTLSGGVLTTKDGEVLTPLATPTPSPQPMLLPVEPEVEPSAIPTATPPNNKKLEGRAPSRP